jgi:hypothetical protein
MLGNYVAQKSAQVTATSMAMIDPLDPDQVINKPVVKVQQTGFDYTRVYGYATDENNAPVSGATVQCFQVFRYYGRATDFVILPYGTTPFRPATVKTGSSGAAFETLISLSNNMAGTTWNGFITPGSMTALVNCKASVSGTVSLFATQQVAMVAQQPLLRVEPITSVLAVGSKVPVKVTVTTIDGTGVGNIPVTLAVSGGATLESSTLGTDSNGVAVFSVDTSAMQGIKAALVNVSASTAGSGFSVAAAQLMFAVRNPGPTISVGAPLGTKVNGANVTLEGSATDPLGFTSVKVKLDGGASVTLSDQTSATTVSLSHSFGKLSSGAHTIVVNATDALGVSTEKTVSFTVEKGKMDILAWSIAAIGWILFVVVAVMMMMRMRKPKPEMMGPEPAESAPPAEQKL